MAPLLLPILLAAAADAGPTRSLQFASSLDDVSPPSPAPNSPTSLARKKPLAISISGGGYRSMFGAIALSRALAADGGWADVTHLASNSGGTWFATMFQYSSGFHADVMDMSKPIQDVVNEAALNIQEAYRRAKDAGELVAVPDIDFVPSCEGRSRASCTAVKATCTSTTVVASALIETALNALVPVPPEELWSAIAYGDWGAMVSKTIVGATQPPALGDIMEPVALAHITYIIQAGMLVDTFLSKDVVACLKPITTDPTTLGWLAPSGASTTEFAAAFVRAATSETGSTGQSGWRFGSAIDRWETATINPTETCATADLSDSTLLELPTPSAEFGASWSGGAVGFLTSPTQLKAYNDVLGLLPSSVLPCFPGEGPGGVGAESMGPPVIRDAGGHPIWRGNDGGTTDNQGLSHAIGRMQEDCKSPGSQLDCSDGIGVVVWDNDPYDFDSSATVRRHFMEPGGGIESRPPGTLMNVFAIDGRNTSAPSMTVFEGAYPPLDEWKPWLTIPVNTTDGDYSADPSQLPAADQPQYWIGDLTTVGNLWYGVEAGTKVKALFLKAMLNQATFVPAVSLPGYAASHYAPTAVAMARDARPVFAEFRQLFE